jgi:N-terminal domain of oxidoreductase/Amidohydrolase family
LRAFPHKTGDGDDRLKLGPIGETPYDGGFTGPTAYTIENYKGQPGFRGTALMSEAALQDMIDTSASLGWQLGIHAVGDKAIVTVADTYARALKKYSKQDARWYLAHLSMIPPASTLDLMARNRIFAAVQPNHLYSVEGRRSKEVSMVARVNRQILLKSRPEGAPSLDNFTLKQGLVVPEPGDGEVLMRTRWLSLDPYMRGRMSAAKSYAKPVEVGATMVGGTVGEVVASRNPNFAVGDIVMGYGGWQDYAVANGSGLRTLNPAAAPVSTALGVLGMPGMTAYAGLLEIGRPQAGETVAVAAASGAVGSVAPAADVDELVAAQRTKRAVHVDGSVAGCCAG